MRERVQDDVFKPALVREPFDVLERLAQDGSAALGRLVGRFGMKKYDDGFRNDFLHVLVGDFGQRLGVRLPAESLRLKTEELHGLGEANSAGAVLQNEAP